MNERAIDKMVEWFDKHPSQKYHYAQREARRLASEEAKEKPVINNKPCPADCVPNPNKCGWCPEVNRDADMLRAFEAKEKPTAPASFYTDIKKWRELFNVNIGFWGMKELDKILSRYRPSTQADIVGYDKPSIPTDKTTGVDEMKFKAE